MAVIGRTMANTIPTTSDFILASYSEKLVQNTVRYWGLRPRPLAERMLVRASSLTDISLR